MSAAHPLKNCFVLGRKAVRLETFDENKRLLGRASGFLVNESDGLFLYTCWHVVTGVDFLKPAPMSRPKRRHSLKVYCQDVQQRQPGVRVIGGGRSVEVTLYDELVRPRWLQEMYAREQPDLQSIGIPVPQSYDVVRIPLELDALLRNAVTFQKEDIFTNFAHAGTDAVILGYPHGYSAMNVASPEPVFLKRSIASNRTPNVGVTLLDGGAAPGMSGGPVLVNHLDRWWLLGMYTGVIFPDHQHGPEGPENDRSAALGLMVHMHTGRVFMDVPKIFDED
jgi:hypothetical protein